jgi:hypothetical protein
VAASAHAVTSGNSVLMHESATAIFRDQVVFTSTDPNATTAIVALNVDFATRVRAGAFLSSANTTGFVQLAGPGFGGFFPFQVTLNSGGSLFFDEGTFTTITGSSGFVDPSTLEQHALLRTASFVVQLNTPVELDLNSPWASMRSTAARRASISPTSGFRPGSMSSRFRRASPQTRRARSCQQPLRAADARHLGVADLV